MLKARAALAEARGMYKDLQAEAAGASDQAEWTDMLAQAKQDEENALVAVLEAETAVLEEIVPKDADDERSAILVR